MQVLRETVARETVVAPRPLRILLHDFCGHPFPFGLGRELARRGHAVKHAYFSGDIGPKGRAERSDVDPAGYDIEAVGLGNEYRKGAFVRRRFQDTVYGRRIAERIRAFRPDIVLSGNTPPNAQGILLKAAEGLDAAFVFWLQDSFGIGVRHVLGGRFFGLGSLVARYYKAMEDDMLRRSRAVVLITEDFRTITDGAGVDDDRVHVIPNWASPDEIVARPKDNPWAAEHGLTGKFVFLYAGTLGLKHDPDLLVALAQAWRDDPDVRIVVASAGLATGRLAAAKAARGLDNLVLLPLQPFERFSDMLGSADVLVGLIERDAATYSVPSKVLSYLCAGRPVLLSIPPENLAARMVREAKAGVVVPAGNRSTFLEAARDLRNDGVSRKVFAANARAYTERHFDIAAITDRFEAIFLAARSVT